MGFLHTVGGWVGAAADLLPLDSVPFGGYIKSHIVQNTQRMFDSAEKGEWGDSAAAWINITMGPLYGAIGDAVLGSDAQGSTAAAETRMAATAPGTAATASVKSARQATAILSSLSPQARAIIVNGLAPRGAYPLLMCCAVILDERPNNDPLAHSARMLLATTTLAASIGQTFAELPGFKEWYDKAAMQYAKDFIKPELQAAPQTLQMKNTFRPLFYALYVRLLELGVQVPSTIQDAVSTYYAISAATNASEAYIAAISSGLGQDVLSEIGIERVPIIRSSGNYVSKVYERTAALVDDVRGSLNEAGTRAQIEIGAQLAAQLKGAIRASSSKTPALVKQYLDIACIYAMNHMQSVAL